MKHKILYVIDNMQYGGGERAFGQLISLLSKDKYEIDVACKPGGVFEEKIISSGASLRPVDMGSRYSPKAILQLFSIMKKRSIDIVHSQGGRADFFTRVAAKLAGVPIIVSTIAMPVEGFDVNPLRKSVYAAFDRFSERFVDKFIVVSKALEHALIEKHRINKEKVVLVPNGIEVEEYRPWGAERRAQSAEGGSQESGIGGQGVGGKGQGVREEFGLGNKIPLVGAIGRLVWQKGFEYLIKAIPSVAEKFPEAKILIVGEGELEAKLKAESEKLKVRDKIIFTGFRQDIKEILSAIDILAMPSLLEGMPFVILEAMAMAKPIVATDIESITEILDNGKTGILVPPKDPDALSRAIISLLTDGDKARQMGFKARMTVEEKFRVEVIVDRVEKVYQELLQSLALKKR